MNTEEFYKVMWDGNLIRYHKVGITENGVPQWTFKSMMDCSIFEEWKIKQVSFDKWIGYSTFTIDYALNHMENTFTDFEEAKKLSKELYNKIIAPKAQYRVARYFDNVFDRYESGSLNKKDAYELKSSFQQRYLYSYELIKVD